MKILNGLTLSGQLISIVSQGTAPLSVGSSTAVSNLNADYLDGQHGSYYASTFNPLFIRQDSIYEGGQINFARASDGATSWYIDAYGAGATPALRFISNTGSGDSVRMYITSTDGTVVMNSALQVGGTISSSSPVSATTVFANSIVKNGGTSSQYLMADGSVSSATSFNGGTISSALTIAAAAPQLILSNATNTQIKFGANGVAAPSFNSYSIGTKIILFDNISASASGHAIGIENGNNWYTSNGGHKFYTGITNTVTFDSSGGVSTNSSVTADQVASTNNGNGTNFKVGDDAWIGDINNANTIRIKGQQSSSAGYIVFGDSDTTALGRTGTGALTYGGNTVYHSGNFVAGTNYVSSTGTDAITNEDRIAPTLLNSWVNYSATIDATSGFMPASYWKDRNGIVHISGLIKNGNAAAGTTLFILPVGYRPYGTEMFVQNSNNQFCRVDVIQTGAVRVQSGATNIWVSLTGMHFKAER